MAPRPGDPAPELDLSTPYDVDVTLMECLLRGPMLVEFLRGTWDPNARQRIDQLNAANDRLGERSTRVLIVTCERVEMARGYLDAHPSPWSFLIDKERTATRAWGVYQRFSFGAFRVAKTSSFLIDRCGFVRLAHVGRSPIDFLPLESIESMLDSFDRERQGGG